MLNRFEVLMTYQESISFLDNLQLHKIKLGLEAMCSFLTRVGQPERQLKIVHVAGTNGKGSVSVSLLTILQQAGYKVGLYTSPHLSSVRERFRIDNRYISEEEFAHYAGRIVEALGDDTITYFEFTTALAMLWFAESDLDLVILETGLGGRLDATNVASPLVSIITSISMDHETYLGNTLTEVAGEKAGIIKKNVPVVAAGGEKEIVSVLKETAERNSAPLYMLGDEFCYSGASNEDWSWESSRPELGPPVHHLRCSMRGAYQRENGSLVIAALRILVNDAGFVVSDEAVQTGMGKVVWPGRLEYLVLDRSTRELTDGSDAKTPHTVRYLLDGAHNPEGVKNLALTLREEYTYRNLILVWGAMNDKDIAGGLARVLPLADSLILTRPEGERSAEPEELAAFLPEEERSRAILARDVHDGLERAEGLASPDDIIVVAGSLYLVGAVRAYLAGELVDQ